MKTLRIKSTRWMLIGLTLLAIFGTLDIASKASAQSATTSAVGDYENSKPVSLTQAESFEAKVTGWKTNNSNWLASLKNIHPLVFAAALVLFVFGVCIMLTDNKELELYLKIDFRPPKTDILN